MEFDPTVSIGNLVAILAALIAAAGVLAALAKDRALRKKEIADRVRQSTALVIAKLDRWKQIALQTFDELEPIATEADGLIVSHSDEISTRDFFWRHAVASQAAMAKNILNEEIEIAYANLYGYDPRIHALFSEAVARLRGVGILIFYRILNRAQFDILTIRDGTEDVISAQLGNRLRYTLAICRVLLETHMEAVIVALRDGMKEIVTASDQALVERRIQVPPPTILPTIEILQRKIYDMEKGDECELMTAETVAGSKAPLSGCMQALDASLASELGAKVLEPWPLGIEFPVSIQRDPAQRQRSS